MYEEQCGEDASCWGLKGLMYNYNKHAEFLIFFLIFYALVIFVSEIKPVSEHTHALILILTCQQFVRKKYRRM